MNLHLRVAEEEEEEDAPFYSSSSVVRHCLCRCRHRVSCPGVWMCGCVYGCVAS